MELKRERHETCIEEKLRKGLERRGYERGVDFATQYPLRHSFILDFAFPDQKVAIEADGTEWHSSLVAKKRDAFKDFILRGKGWIVLRFWDYEIEQDIAGCIRKIAYTIQERGRR